MTNQFTYLTVAIALAISLVACETAPLPQRATLAQNTTPWSENPFLNPCWPN